MHGETVKFTNAQQDFNLGFPEPEAGLPPTPQEITC